MFIAGRKPLASTTALALVKACESAGSPSGNLLAHNSLKYGAVQASLSLNKQPPGRPFIHQERPRRLEILPM